MSANDSAHGHLSSQPNFLVEWSVPLSGCTYVPLSTNNSFQKVLSPLDQFDLSCKSLGCSFGLHHVLKSPHLLAEINTWLFSEGCKIKISKTGQPSKTDLLLSKHPYWLLMKQKLSFFSTGTYIYYIF